jgi:spore coat-associated protein N
MALLPVTTEPRSRRWHGQGRVSWGWEPARLATRSVDGDSRTATAGRHDRRLIFFPLCVLMLFALAVGVSTSKAGFTRSSSSPHNVLAAGAFGIFDSQAGAYVINVSAVRPGQSVTGTATIANQGDYVGGVTILNGGLTDTPASPALSSALTLTIEDISGTPKTLWTGAMGTFSSLAVADFGLGESRTYRFTAAFPQANAVPAQQSARSVLTLRFVGVAK